MSDQNSEVTAPSLASFRATVTHRDELTKDNKIGVVALSCACVGLATVFVPILSPALGLAGVVLGVVALRSARDKDKATLAAKIALGIGTLAVFWGSLSSAMIIEGWNHLRACNHAVATSAANSDEICDNPLSK